MLKYDSVHGRFNGDIAVDGGNMVVNGKKIRLTAERDPANLKWNEVGADIVIDCTGFFLTTESCEATSRPARRKWCNRLPSKDATPMFVYGVNHTPTPARPSCLPRPAPPTAWLRSPRC